MNKFSATEVTRSAFHFVRFIPQQPRVPFFRILPDRSFHLWHFIQKYHQYLTQQSKVAAHTLHRF
jgi:hypothetical protein